MTVPESDDRAFSLTSWERWVNSFFGWVPYVTLAISLVISQIGSSESGEKVIVLGLAAAVVLWTWIMFSRLGPPASIEQKHLYVYFAGFLVLATALTLRDTVFLVFAMTGFFHASLLRPWTVAFAGIMASGFVVHSHIVINDPSPVARAIYLGVVAIQTVAVAAGLYAGERIAEIAEERRLTLLRLDLAIRENASLQEQLVLQAREHGVLDERQRMAREIHDTIAQSFTGIIRQLEAITVDGEAVDFGKRLVTATQLAREGLSEARRSVQALRPGALDRSRLPEAVGKVTTRWSEINNIPARVAVVGEVRSLRPAVEVVFLRAVQEGLTNIAKHADAEHLRVTLSFMDDSVALDIRDNGRGFDPAEVVGEGSFGLAAMRQRVEGLGGELTIESARNEGTALSIVIPTGFGDEGE